MFEPWFTVSQPDGERLAPSVWAGGDIDLATVDEFDAVLRSVAVESDEVDVDLRAVTYCDSSALRVLFALATDIKMTLTVTASGPILTILRISGLDRLTTVNVVD